MVRRGTKYRSLRLQKRDFRFQGLPRTYSILQPESGDGCGLSTWNLTSYKIWCPCQERPAKKKNLVQQTIASRWWCVVTVRSLQTISRYAALRFWDLVCSTAVRSSVSWEGRQFVAHFANQRNSGVLTILISAFPFYNTTWSLTLTLMLLFTCWTHPKIFIQCWLIFCDVWTLGISTMEPLIMWTILSADIYWVQHSSTSRRGVAFKQRQTDSKLSKVSRTWQMTQFVIREWLEDILGSFASTTTAFNQVHHLHGRPFGTLLPRIVR